MSTQLIQPVEFTEAKREKFCLLVGVGVSRRHAAASMGLSPSAISRQMAADPLFAEKVREAETDCELALMGRVRSQSERSWRAAVWLLEHMRPERYARGKNAAPAAPSWDEMFDKFVALIDQEVGNDSLRVRLMGRLDELAMEELAARELDGSLTARSDAPVPTLQRNLVPSPQVEAAQQTRVDEPLAAPKENSEPSAEELVAAILRRDDARQRRQRPSDLCNTSPSVHERRKLSSIRS